MKKAGKTTVTASYRPLTESSVCLVTTIEIITCMNNVRELTDALETLQQYSAAEVVAQQMVGDDFETNSAILMRRRMTNRIA